MSDPFASGPTPASTPGPSSGSDAQATFNPPAAPPPGVLAGPGLGAQASPNQGVHPQWQVQEASSKNYLGVPSVTPGPRVVSRFVDWLAWLGILIIPAFFFAAIFFVFASFLLVSDGESGLVTSPAVSVFGSVIGLIFQLIAIFINEVLLVSKKGGNLGKLITGLRIIDVETGEFPSMKQAFKRALVYAGFSIAISVINLFLPDDWSLFAGGIGSVWSIVIFVSIVTAPPLFQGWHDKYAGTRVIKKEPYFIQ